MPKTDKLVLGFIFIIISYFLRKFFPDIPWWINLLALIIGLKLIFGKFIGIITIIIGIVFIFIPFVGPFIGGFFIFLGLIFLLIF